MPHLSSVIHSTTESVAEKVIWTEFDPKENSVLSY